MTEYSKETYTGPSTAAPHGAPPVTDKAADAAEAAKQGAGEVARTATDKVKDVTEDSKAQARNLIGEARAQVGQQASTQQRNLVMNLRSLVDELQGMAQRSEQPGPATELVRRAQDRLHGVADWLDRREPGDVLNEVRTFASRRPGVFLLGSVAAGAMAGRLTRGVVAAHSDDSGHAEPPPDGPTAVAGFEAPVPPSRAVTDAVGYDAPAAGMTSGYVGGTP
jgi:hypothetical protein